MLHSSPRASDWKFWLVAGLIVMAACAGVILAWPGLKSETRAYARYLVQQGRGVTGNEALLDFHLAYLLDPHNTDAVIGLADYELATGQTTAALHQLDRGGEGSAVLGRRLRAELETNQLDDAVRTASQLLDGTSTQNDLLTSAVAFALTGHNDQLSTVISRVTSPEALQRVTRLQASRTAIGAELYALELPDASQRLLRAQPDSLIRDLLLGHLLSRHSAPSDLREARDFYTGALHLDPTSIEARQGLADTLRRLGDTSGAGQQAALLGQLSAGRP